MDLAQNDFADINDMLEPSLEAEQPMYMSSPSSPAPAFRGVMENVITRIFLNALKESPGIWKNILCQKQVRNNNPAWEYITFRCGFSDVRATRKYYAAFKKDIFRRVDMSLKKGIITDDKLKMDGLRKLHESQSNYKYWDDADFLVKHIILKRRNIDLDNMDMSLDAIKRETTEDQHQDQDPDALTAQSTTIEVDEVNSSQIDVSDIQTGVLLQSIKQELEPVGDSQMQAAGPFFPENHEEPSVNEEDASTLITIKNEEPLHIDGGYDDDSSSQTQVRLIISGIECQGPISNDPEDLPTSMEMTDVDMEDENMDVEESREDMSRRRAEAKECAHQFFMERIFTLPTEEMRVENVFRFNTYGHKMNTLASHRLEEFNNELKTFKF